jgi:hypothetical protein
MKFALVVASLLMCLTGCTQPQDPSDRPAGPQPAADTSAARVAKAKPLAPATSITYRNAQYGFCFALPLNWKGYSIVHEQWRGLVLSSGQVVHGPELLIRNPLWTESDRFQDIPIMVFTQAQWKQADNVEMSVSAAPVGPSKLGQTSGYVFALPPRWIGFTDAAGTPDVQTWMEKDRLRAPCVVSKPKPAPPPAPQAAN